MKLVWRVKDDADKETTEWLPNAENTNQGDDISGVVHEVGENVVEFKKGDRVAAFHEMLQPGGSYAEYAVAWKHTTFFLPKNISFEGKSFTIQYHDHDILLTIHAEGAAIPLAALTAAVGLYARLRLPEPWLPAADGSKTPLVIYGASSAVGSYTLQLAVKSNIHPIITVAGRAKDHVEKFIDRSKGDTIIDYREGDEAVVKGLKEALGGQKLLHAFDAVSEKGSVENLAQVLDPNGAITFVLPGKEYKGYSETTNLSTTTVGDVHSSLKDFGYVHSRFLSKGLEEGWFKAQPQEIIPGGLEGVEKGLSNLKDGTASAIKYIFKIEDTPGAGSGK